MHLGMTYSEVRGIPIRYRRWFIDRLLKYFKDKNNKTGASEAAADNNKSFSQYQEQLNKKFGE